MIVQTNSAQLTITTILGTTFCSKLDLKISLYSKCKHIFHAWKYKYSLSNWIGNRHFLCALRELKFNFRLYVIFRAPYLSKSAAKKRSNDHLWYSSNGHINSGFFPTSRTRHYSIFGARKMKTESRDRAKTEWSEPCNMRKAKEYIWDVKNTYTAFFCNLRNNT